MEVTSTILQDVAEPDQVVSGSAGTGHELNIKTGLRETTHGTWQPITHTRIVIGLGVLYNGPIEPQSIPFMAKEPDTCPEISSDREIPDKLIFSLFDHTDHVRDRIQKKVDRLDQRTRKLEDRRRSQ